MQTEQTQDTSYNIIDDMLKEQEKVEVSIISMHVQWSMSVCVHFAVITSVAVEFWEHRSCKTTFPNRTVILHTDRAYVCIMYQSCTM